MDGEPVNNARFVDLLLGPGSTRIRPHRSEAFPRAPACLSSGRLQAGRVHPFVQIERGIGLPGFHEKHIPLRSGPELVGLLTDFICPRGKSILKGELFFETPPL